MQRLRRRAAWPLLALIVAACGAATTEPQAQQPVATSAATQTVPTTAVPENAPATVATQAPTVSVEPSGGLRSEQGLPVGQTAEGYWYLGRADAPVTLTMYSDFL